MLIALIQRIAEAYAAPRRSARRLLASNAGFQDGVLMALAGTILGMVSVLAAEQVFGRDFGAAILDLMPQEVRDAVRERAPDEARPASNLALAVIAGVATSLLYYAALVSLATAIGRRAGGKATLQQIAVVAGWWVLVQVLARAALTVAVLSSRPEDAGTVVFAFIAVALFVFYQLAAFLAEAHGFSSVFKVLLTMAGLALLFSMLMQLAAAMMGVQIAPV